MYGWNEKPTKATTHQFIGGENPRAVYEIGQYEVTVEGSSPDNHPAVTYKHKYRQTTDPRHTLPNMEIADGEIRIPVTDLVGEALKRLEPVDLAKALWTEQEVRDEFMYCLSTRYTESGIGDADRRKFLAGVKEAVHSKALDALASAMAKCEWELSKIANHYDEVRRINDFLRERDIRNSKGEIVQLNTRDHSIKNEAGNFQRGELEVSGKAWEEARAYWRDEVVKRFPSAEPELEPA